MKIAILGYGTIGSGVFEIFENNSESITKRAGQDIEVKYVLDLREFPGDPVENKLVHDFRVVAEDEEIGCVVETMGGVEPAYSFVKELLLRGKSVCTSNKELVAKHGAELLEIARQKKKNFFFEASVGGAIPLIRPINESFAGDEITDIYGIVNGTTNYILSKMTSDGAKFEDVLKKAQAKGYAERKPEADVEGYDACRKIAILSSLATGAHVDYEDIYTEGITKITAEDIAYAKKMNKVIKLIASMQKKPNGVEAAVCPMLIGPESPLYAVNGVFNAICVTGKYTGQVMFYGRGAGKLPTAAAVAGDVVEATRHENMNEIVLWSPKKLNLCDRAVVKNNFFIRVKEEDKALANTLFDKIEEIESNKGEYAFVANEVTEGEIAEIGRKLNLISRIRILH